MYIDFGTLFFDKGQEMQQVYAWVDEIPLTRPKRNIARDFSDGGIASECNIPYLLLQL